MNSVLKYIIACLIGCSVGFVGGFQGIAGGFYIEMLLLATQLVKNQSMAAGTTLLAVVFPISIGAVYEYWKNGNIDIPVALIITFFYIIFAWLGAKVNNIVDEQIVLYSLAIMLALTSLYFTHKAITHKNKK